MKATLAPRSTRGSSQIGARGMMARAVPASAQAQAVGQ